MSNERDKIMQMSGDLRSVVAEAYFRVATLDDKLKHTTYIPCDAAAHAEQWLRDAWKKAPCDIRIEPHGYALRNKIIDSVVAETRRQYQCVNMVTAKEAVDSLATELRGILWRELNNELFDLREFKRKVLAATGGAQ